MCVLSIISSTLICSRFCAKAKRTKTEEKRKEKKKKKKKKRRNGNVGTAKRYHYFTINYYPLNRSIRLNRRTPQTEERDLADLKQGADR